MNKKILILLLILSVILGGCSSLSDEKRHNKFKKQMLQENRLNDIDLEEIKNGYTKSSITNNKQCKSFKFNHKNIKNSYRGRQNIFIIWSIDFKRIVRRIIKKYFLKNTDRKNFREFYF
ncbi:hypothetical protein [Clostridium ganghwense]|uniref:Lipoprotein n=1 Tax=Clostridium ganghwense TaxID=312089 RepID=A0ABT4CQ31_9CLOT|nr:hypothetical protein [Clostridium ganghwense]MCY6371127.1 hypothetical protein [Clostridium ganghwense]